MAQRQAHSPPAISSIESGSLESNEAGAYHIRPGDRNNAHYVASSPVPSRTTNHPAISEGQSVDPHGSRTSSPGQASANDRTSYPRPDAVEQYPLGPGEDVRAEIPPRTIDLDGSQI